MGVIDRTLRRHIDCPDCERERMTVLRDLYLKRHCMTAYATGEPFNPETTRVPDVYFAPDAFEPGGRVPAGGGGLGDG